jgi:hypothetical protein
MNAAECGLLPLFNEAQTTDASTLEICEVGPSLPKVFALEFSGEVPKNGITTQDYYRRKRRITERIARFSEFGNSESVFVQN